MPNLSEIAVARDPQNQIALLDGSIIYGIPATETPAATIDNTLRLDTTGEYLAVKYKKPAKSSSTADPDETQLFLRHAFFFLHHREAILSDSRLFLTPVPMCNGLAYTGTSGFKSPTLGVYIEWWLNCDPSIYFGKDTHWLICRFGGSPLTGMNSCFAVNIDGNTEAHQSTSFSSLWGNFQKINTRYDDAKTKFQAYTLAEAIEVLKKLPPLKNAVETSLQIFFQQRDIDKLWEVIEQYQQDMRKMRSKITDLTIKLHYDFISDVYRRYAEEAASVNARLNEAYEQRKALRLQLKQGLISNKEHQHRLSPVNKTIKEAYPQLISKYINAFRDIEPSLTIFDVVDFFKAQNPQTPNQQ